MNERARPLILALPRRSPTATGAILLPARRVVLPVRRHAHRQTLRRRDVTVVSHNVHDENPDPKGTARGLTSSGADLIALEEQTQSSTPVFERVRAAESPGAGFDRTVEHVPAA